MTFSGTNAKDGSFNNRGSLKDAGRFAYRGPFAVEALREARQHAENVHAPEVVRERQQREQAKRYAAFKDELARHRAASGR